MSNNNLSGTGLGNIKYANMNINDISNMKKYIDASNMKKNMDVSNMKKIWTLVI